MYQNTHKSKYQNCIHYREGGEEEQKKRNTCNFSVRERTNWARIIIIATERKYGNEEKNENGKKKQLGRKERNKKATRSKRGIRVLPCLAYVPVLFSQPALNNSQQKLFLLNHRLSGQRRVVTGRCGVYSFPSRGTRVLYYVPCYALLFGAGCSFPTRVDSGRN